MQNQAGTLRRGDDSERMDEWHSSRARKAVAAREKYSNRACFLTSIPSRRAQDLVRESGRTSDRRRNLEAAPIRLVKDAPAKHHRQCKPRV